MDKKKAKIFIVDDEPISLGFLSKSLSKKGYDCLAIKDSLEVIELARKDPPDLFLLDFMMPGLNGIELCHLLKNDNLFKEIPVIFITANEETSQKVEAFNAGAVDYITKPINSQEVSARIKTHLELFTARKEIGIYAANMEKLAEERARQLIHADRLATLGTLSAGVAHEINNPTTFISGNVQTLEDFWLILKIEVKKAILTSSENRKKLKFIDAEMPELISGIKDGVMRIKKIVDSLKAFSYKGIVEKELSRVSECIDNALMLCHKLLKDNVQIEKNIKDTTIIFSGDPQKIEQVLVNLLVNAVDATKDSQDAVISIEVLTVNKRIKIIVSDNGSGISEENISEIWNPFFTTKDSAHGTGLGLSVSRAIIEEHGGEISAFNRKEGGVRVEVFLPLPIDN